MNHGQYRFNKPNGRGGATLFGPSLDRLGKLIRLLASDVDSEALGACRALHRCLAEAGADFHHLAGVVEDGWRDPLPAVVDITPEQRPDWQLFAAELLKYPHLLLGDRELDFLHNMARSRYAPTAAQEKWMNDINARRSRAAS